MEIARNEKLADISANDKEVVRQSLKKEIEERSTLMAEKENQIKNIETQLGTIKDNVHKMVEAFR